MNFLRLCRYLYTKRLANEIILLIQLVCMIELSFVVLNPVDSFLADRANVTQAYTIDFNEVIHFSENNAMMSADIRGQEMPIDIIYQRIKETDGVKNILCFGFCNGLYTYRGGRKRAVKCKPDRLFGRDDGCYISAIEGRREKTGS